MTTSRGGRPPVGPRITLRFPTDLLARLDAHAEATGTTRSDLLRRGAERILKEDTMTTTGVTYTDHGTAYIGHLDGHVLADEVPTIYPHRDRTDLPAYEVVITHAHGERSRIGPPAFLTLPAARAAAQRYVSGPQAAGCTRVEIVNVTHRGGSHVETVYAAEGTMKP